MDGLFHGKSQSTMDDDWGDPYFRKALHDAIFARFWFIDSQRSMGPPSAWLLFPSVQVDLCFSPHDGLPSISGLNPAASHQMRHRQAQQKAQEEAETKVEWETRVGAGH